MLTIYHDLLLINFKHLLFVAWGIKICIFYLPGKLLSWKDTWDCVRIGTIVWTHSLWKVITISRRTSEIQNIYQINILYSWWFNKPSKSQITIRSQKYWKNLLFVVTLHDRLTYWKHSSHQAITNSISVLYLWRGCHGHDRMVIGFTTTCEISVYHH